MVNFGLMHFFQGDKAYSLKSLVRRLFQLICLRLKKGFATEMSCELGWDLGLEFGYQAKGGCNSAGLPTYPNQIRPKRRFNENHFRRNWEWLFFSLIFLSSLKGQQVFGQAVADTSLQASSNSSRVGIFTFAFRNQLAGYVGPFQEGKHHLWVMAANDHVINTALSGNQLVTADALFGARHRWDVLPWLSIYSGGQVFDFAANKTRLLSAGSGLETRHRLGKQGFSVGAGLEVVSDKRLDITNVGPSYELRGVWQSFHDSTLLLMARGRISETDISPRRNRQYLGMLRVEKRFNQNAEIGLQAGLNGRRVEDYLVTGNSFNIQSIGSDTVDVRLNLRYNLLQNLYFRSNNQYLRPDRDFRYLRFEGNDLRQSTAYTQNEFRLRQELEWVLDKLLVSGRIEYNVRDRIYRVENNLNLSPIELNRALELERVKDITEASTAYFTQLRWMPNRRHVVQLNTTAQLLRVDTRSDQNNQDRDELLYLGEFSHQFFWLKNFRTDLKFAGTYRHFVYITPTQSIENFKERILRLEPGFRWQTGRFSWLGSYSLFVTYHVRDFEEEQGKNRSNRIFLTSHQLRYGFKNNYAVQADILRRENRLGRLNWERFAESPIDTVVIWDVALRAEKSFLRKWGSMKGQLGYRVFRQGRSQTQGISVDGVLKTAFIENVVLQHGPVAFFSTELGDRFSLQADFWIQNSILFNIYRIGEEPFIGPSTTIEELERRQENFLPNFTVSFVYRPFVR